MSAPAPRRTCVGCRQIGDKRSLLRIVRATDGAVRPDPTGKAPGRGAYVHRDPECVDRAIRRGALGRALRTHLDRDGAGRLRIEIETEVAR